MFAVAIQTVWIHHTQTLEQAKTRAILLRPNKWVGIGRNHVRSATALNEHCGRTLTLPQTRALMYMSASSLNRRNGFCRSCSAGTINTYVGDGTVMVRGSVDTEHLVEAGYAIRLGWGHLQLFADIVEATLADPTSLVLQGVQRRKQHMA